MTGITEQEMKDVLQVVGVENTDTSLFTDETINDAAAHDSDATDISEYRHASIYLLFENLAGSGPSQVRVTEFNGNSSVQGEENYWDVTDISEGDEITIPVPEEFAGSHIKVRLENKDGDPTTNYCDVTTILLSKS